MAGLHSIRARLEALAARAPTSPSAWPEVQFPIVESAQDGRPVITGRLIRDTATPAGWREIPPNA
jgi:hypothetical protein